MFAIYPSTIYHIILSNSRKKMSGIAGFYYYRSENFVHKNIFLPVCQKLKNRGPDDSGFFISHNKKFGLVNTRLAIVDTRKINFPISNESSDLWMTFDGEILNYKDLRKYLLTRGHIFNSNTDSEVVIHLYEEFQEQMLESIRGMFVFAIWDDLNETLLLCRDKIGMKPLFYYKDTEKFAFASDLPTILSFPVKKEINTSALKLYFVLGYIPSPFTIFKNIFKLQQGYLIKFENNKMSIKKYYEPQFITADKKIRYEELTSDIFTRLREAVEVNISDEVDTGILLSGGINSSIITGLCSLSSQKKIKTFSLSGFCDKNVKSIARHFNTEHSEIECKVKFSEILQNVIYHLGEPFVDTSIIPFYELTKNVSSKVKYVLTGFGARNIFWNEQKYLFTRLNKFLFFPLSRISPILSEFIKLILPNLSSKDDLIKIFTYASLDDFKRYINMVSIFTIDELSRFLDVEGVYEQIIYPLKGVEQSSRGVLCDIFDFERLLPDNVLHKIDIISMANSLEVRMPFLDHLFADFVFDIPPRYKSGNKILRDTFKNLLPEEVFQKDAFEFYSPSKNNFQNLKLQSNEMNFIFDTLNSKDSTSMEIFGKREIEKIILRKEEKKIWALVVLNVWQSIYQNYSILKF